MAPLPSCSTSQPRSGSEFSPVISLTTSTHRSAYSVVSDVLLIRARPLCEQSWRLRKAVVCYVDGARDDLARRSFYLLKKSGHTETRKAIERLPFAGKMKA